jgi:hypothetical protein
MTLRVAADCVDVGRAQTAWMSTKGASVSERDPSRTALETAYARAVHLLLDEPPYVLADRVAISMLAEGAEHPFSLRSVLCLQGVCR